MQPLEDICNMVKALLVEKLVILYLILFTVNSLGGSIALAFVNTEWSSMSSTSKFLIIVLIVQNWTGTMLAFVNKAYSRVSQDKPILTEGDTAIINK